MTAPPPLQLRCRDLAEHEDIALDLGIPAGAFGFHDWDDLVEPCLCASERPLRVDEGLWDAQGRHDHNRRLDERNRSCHDRLVLDGDGWHAVLCCRCTSDSEADDDVLAEVAKRVAEAMREAEQPAPATTAEALCFALARSIDLVAKGRPIQSVNRAGRALRRESHR